MRPGFEERQAARLLDDLEALRGGGLSSALQRAAEWQATGFPGSTSPNGGVSGSGVGRPTEAQALAKPSRENLLLEAGRARFRVWCAASASLLSWLRSTEPSPGVVMSVCVNPVCDEATVVDETERRGVRCRPCQRYFDANSVDASPETVDARQRQRRRRSA